MKYPEILSNLIECLKTLPGVGEKTAERYAFSLLEQSEDARGRLIQSINDMDRLKKCSICNYITEEDTCSICNDKSRDNGILCVVEDAKTVLLFEKIGSFSGKYHVLNGLISPIERLLKDSGVLVTRIANGIPIGAEIDYIDAMTLEMAFENRNELV